MMRVDIIIVNYNSGAWLKRSLQSALAFSEAVVHVVDNNSSDNSIELAQKEHQENARLRWHLNSDNKGFAAANNQVLKELEGDFCVLMNPDCELKENTLARIIEQFHLHPKMGLASCLILNQDGSVQATCRRRFPTPWSAFVRLLQLHRLFKNNPRFANFDYGDDFENSNDEPVQWVEAVSGSFMVVRDNALKQVGLLDEAYFMHCEDLDWCKRFHLAHWKVGFVSSATVMHAKGVSSQTRALGVLANLHQGMWRYYKKFHFADTAWPLKVMVAVGIVVSFMLRACKVLVFKVIKR